MAGRMSYLTDRRAQIRTDPKLLLPCARSIICVAQPYEGPATGVPIARYAQRPDYHDTMRADLERLVVLLTDEFGSFEYKICLDTAPLLERSYARLAGLGWIGRNTCLINQQIGSWFFLGEIVTSLELQPGEAAADRCGTCTRCIDACPTDALASGGMRTELDATRCISYLTIELKGTIPEEHRSGVGEHVFGCDICQEVCPWNAPGVRAQEDADRLASFATLTPDQFREQFRNTPVWRTRYQGFLRNVAVALGNSADARHRNAIERLAQSEDPVVAEHARWALERLEVCA
jgi:epoxyqueuosine reductase